MMIIPSDALQYDDPYESAEADAHAAELTVI